MKTQHSDKLSYTMSTFQNGTKNGEWKKWLGLAFGLEFTFGLTLGLGVSIRVNCILGLELGLRLGLTLRVRVRDRANFRFMVRINLFYLNLWFLSVAIFSHIRAWYSTSGGLRTKEKKFPAPTSLQRAAAKAEPALCASWHNQIGHTNPQTGGRRLGIAA